MSRYYGGWAPYVPVAERRRKAERAMEKRRKAGHPVAPVTITGRAIATTFWGQAWCDNMEGYHDYENRLPRGRTYVRNGSVVDLQIAQGQVTAVVSGSELYNVTITIKETPKPHWRSICTDCAGGIDSLVELLQGRFSKGVMERLCRQQGGLFPRPSDIRFSCSCPDVASMCKHVAAVLYGVGARLDDKPELLFRLRAVDEKELVAHIDTALPMSKHGPAAGRVLDGDDVSALFGLDMAAPEEPAAARPSAKPKRARTPVPAPEEAVPVVKAPVRPSVAGPKQAAVGKSPAKPIPKQQVAAGRQAPVKLPTPKKAAAASKVIPRRSSAPKHGVTAKAPSRKVVAGRDAAAAVKVEDERTKPRKAQARDGAQRRTNASVVTSAAPAVSARSRGKQPDPKSNAVAVRGAKQKPVKWW